MADNTTDWVTGDIPQNGMTQEQWNEKQRQDWLAQQQGGGAQAEQPEQGGGMVAPYYSGPAPTGMGSDPKARLAAVFGAMKGAQPATDTGGGAAEIMAAIDEFPALSGYLKYGRTFGKSSDQSTDSWARSMGAVAGPMINALVQSQANRSQNEVAGANQRMSLLDGAVSRLAEEPRPQIPAQNPRDYHANTLLQSADKDLSRLDNELAMAYEQGGIGPDMIAMDDKALAAMAQKDPKFSQWVPWIQRHRADREQAKAKRQFAEGRLGIGGVQGVQSPTKGLPNAASKSAAMITNSVPNAAKKMFEAKIQPAGGGGPVSPVGGGGNLGPARQQGGGPSIWPSSRFRPPVPPARPLDPITLRESDFKTGAVPMPQQRAVPPTPVAPVSPATQPVRPVAAPPVAAPMGRGTLGITPPQPLSKRPYAGGRQLTPEDLALLRSAQSTARQGGSAEIDLQQLLNGNF